MISIFLTLLKHIKTTEEGRKPRAYFQFWASHVFIVGLGMYTVVDNNTEYLPTVIFFIIFLFLAIIWTFYFRTMELSVIFKFCCNCRCYSIIVLYISLFILSAFTFLFLLFIPNVILIFCFYPVDTVIRLPFILNSILYTNSILALLIYQCERCSYQCKFGHDKDPFYEEYYQDLRSDCESKTIRFGYMLKPVVTFNLLLTLMLFIATVYDLLNMNLNKFKEAQIEMLFILVPTLLLLFGSWYRLDLFFDVKEDKSEKELLKEMLQEIKKLNSKVCVESTASGVVNSACDGSAESHHLINPSDNSDGGTDTKTHVGQGQVTEPQLVVTESQPDECTPLVQQ